MKAKKGNCEIIVEAGQMEISALESNYNEDVYFKYIKLMGVANKISNEKEMENLAEKFNEYYDGNGILYQLPNFFETASEIEIRFEDALNEISSYFIGTVKTVKEIYPEVEKLLYIMILLKLFMTKGMLKLLFQTANLIRKFGLMQKTEWQVADLKEYLAKLLRNSKNMLLRQLKTG